MQRTFVKIPEKEYGRNREQLVREDERTAEMLRALHLPGWKVHEMANCRKGTWRAAEMLNSVFTRKILVDRLGYPSMTAHYLKVRVNY